MRAGREDGAGLAFLLAPGVLAARRRFESAFSVARALALGAVAAAFWALLFAVLYRLLVYFRSAQEIGDALAAKLLGVILLAFLAVLLLSNIVTALSTFFLARDLELLMASPTDSFRLYLSRLLATLAHSSWMVGLVLVPILVAYGIVYEGGLAYVATATGAVIGYLLIPSVVGAAVTLLLVNVFPARRARDLLAMVGLVGAGAFIALVRMLRPEQLAGPDGFRSLVDFVASLQTPSSPWLPSEWAAEAIMASLGGAGRDFFPLLLLLSTAAALLVLGAWLHERLYREGFSRAQEGAEMEEKGERGRLPERILAGASPTVRALFAKEVRTFFRDTTQWSQLILLAVLVVVYIYNVKALPLWTGEQVSYFLVNVISFLNLGLAGFVLAAIAARFLFPAVSLEGRTLWLLRSSPLDLRTLLWTKYWAGTIPLLVLAVTITLATNLILRVSPFIMILSLATITVMTFAIAALAIGFGALYPRFGTENAAQISTGFGGLIFMMTAVAYLAAVVVLEAWPVHTVLRARFHGRPLDTEQIVWLAGGLAAALAISVAAIVLPLRVAVRRVGEMEV